jgi:hypothetical protein
MLKQRQRFVYDSRWPGWLGLSAASSAVIAVPTAGGELVHLSVPRIAPRGSAERLALGRFGAVVDAASGRVLACGPAEGALVSDLQRWEACREPHSAVVFEKLCGIPCMLYWHVGKWKVASQFEAEGVISLEKGGREGGGSSVAELFWRLFGGSSLPPPNDNRCYCFILCSARHRFVVHHQQEGCFLVAARDLGSGRELTVWRVADALGWRCAPIRGELQSLHDARASLLQMHNPFVCGGFVVAQGALRWSLATPEYVSVSCTSSRKNFGFGPLGNLEAEHLEAEDFDSVLKRGEREQFALWFGAKWGAQLAAAASARSVRCQQLAEAYARLVEDGPSKKTFALRVKGLATAALFFELFNGKLVNLEEWFFFRDNDPLLGDGKESSSPQVPQGDAAGPK